MKCSKIINAVRYGGNTLVGVGKREYPLRRGNCCDVEGEDGKHYRILNFVAENLKELVKRGLTWPIKIELLGKRVATIVDRRVPPEWYADHFCTVCTPRNLLPYPQRLQQLLAVERGERKEGKDFTSIDRTRSAEFAYANKEYDEKRKKQDEAMKGWTVNIKEGIVVIDSRAVTGLIFSDEKDSKKKDA